MTSLIDFSKPTNIISSEKYFNLSQKYRCLTSEAQINFLCNLIKNYKLNNNTDIKNVVEIGTNLGFTAHFMLEAGVENFGKNFKLTSFDLCEEEIGRVVEENSTQQEKECFALFKGTTFPNYCTNKENWFEQNKIDLAFVDGQHTHPGPLIDVLFLLPFMKKGGLIVFHDINHRFDPDDWGACYVYDCLNAEKVSLERDIIGYIVVPDDITTLYDNLIHIAKQPFNACIWIQDKTNCFAEREIPLLENFLPKHYGNDFATKILTIMKNNIARYNEFNLDLAKRAEASSFMFFKILELENKVNYLTSNLENLQFETLQLKCNNKKVLLYGAGLNAQYLINKFDFSKLNIVGICDKKFEKDKIEECLGFKTFSPSNIKDINYDFILLMVREKEYIKEYLINTFDVDKNKIIEFWYSYLSYF